MSHASLFLPGHSPPLLDSMTGTAHAHEELSPVLLAELAEEEAMAAPSNTALAIRAHIARLNSKSAEERAAYGQRFTDPEAVFKALDAATTSEGIVGDTDIVEEQVIVLLRGSWLKEQTSDLFRLPIRGTSLPPEATITVDELRVLWARRDQLGNAHRALPFIAISHLWRTRTHPDPDGLSARMIVQQLRACWGDFKARGLFELGVFIDWCCVFQAPGVKAKYRARSAALRDYPLWYAHKCTTVWLLGTEKDLKEKQRSYWQNGWATCEYGLASLLKPSHAISPEWPQLVDLCKSGRAQLELDRPAPAEPLVFQDGHEFGAKHYHLPDDREHIVAPMYRSVILEMISGASMPNAAVTNPDDARCG